MSDTSNVIGFCDLHYSPSLDALTTNRPFGCVSFLGRYGIIDFTLSNFSNSGINRVVILAKDNIHSVIDHIQSGQAWLNNTKTGFVQTVINERCINNPTFNTDVANMAANITAFNLPDVDYYVLAPVHLLTSMDFRPIIDAHIQSKAGITMVYTTADNSKGQFKNCTSIKLDRNKKYVKSTRMHDNASKVDVSLDTFIFSKDALLDLLKMQKNISSLLSVADVISFGINGSTLKVNAYRHTGKVYPIFSLLDYVNVSMMLLNHQERTSLFLDNWPIYTTTHDTPPSLYGPKSDVRNSFIANGSIIRGKVENSIISRNVTVEEGASIKNSIIFTRTTIGKDVHVENAICDKDCKIRTVKNVSGSADEYIIISKGENI